MKIKTNISFVLNVLLISCVCLVFCGCEKLQEAVSKQYKKTLYKGTEENNLSLIAKSLTYKQLSRQPINSPIEEILYGREMLKKASDKTETALANLYISRGLINLKNFTEAKKTLESIPDDYSTSRDENFTLQKKNKQAKVAYQLGDYDAQLKYLNDIIKHKNNYNQTVTFVLSAKMCAADTLALLGRNEEAKRLLKEVSEVNDTPEGLHKYYIKDANHALTKFNKYSDNIFEQQNYTIKELKKKKDIYDKFGSDFMNHIDEIFIKPHKKNYQLIIFSNEVMNSLIILNNQSR